MASKPKLDDGGFVLANAYSVLSRCRPGGFGLTAIDPRAIWEWLDRNGVREPIVRQHFEAVIIAIDNITLRRASKKQKGGGPSAEKPEKPTKPGRPEKPAPVPKSPAPSRRRKVKP